MRSSHFGLSVLLAFSSIAAAPVTGPAEPTPVAGVGSTVATALRGKPVVVRLHADWCGECQTTLPDFVSFAKAYRGKITVVDFDVTDGKTSAVAKARAETLGLGPFYERTKAAPLTVAFINPDSGKVYAALRGNVDRKQLVAAERTVERSMASH